MYTLDFDSSLTTFQWNKVPIGCTGPRAHHSCTFLPNLNSIAIVGGITCAEDGTCVRQKLAVVLVDISTWVWTEFKISDDLCLSSTKMVLAGRNTLAYFGGYTSRFPSMKQEENRKTAFWGTVSFHEEPNTSQMKVQWQGKSTRLGSFACADAIRVGNDILLSCGTDQKWGVCTSIKPTLQPCDIPQCTANTRSIQEPTDGFKNWIRW